jgi:hypothetical protein
MAQEKRPMRAACPSGTTKKARLEPSVMSVQDHQSVVQDQPALTGNQEGHSSSLRVKTSSTELHTHEKKSRNRRIRRRNVILPELEVKQSLVPEGGRGVFAKEYIKSGQWVTEYGGEVVGNEIAGQRRLAGDDTHIRSAGFMDLCIDSRVRDSWQFDYYTRYSIFIAYFMNVASKYTE